MTTRHLAALNRDCDNASERLRRYIAVLATVHPNEIPDAPAALVGMLQGDDVTTYFRTESTRCAKIGEPLAIIALRPHDGPLSQSDERTLFNALSELITQPGDAIAKRQDGTYLVFSPWESATPSMATSFAGHATSALPNHDWDIGYATVTLAHLQLPPIACTPAPTRLRPAPTIYQHSAHQGRS